MTEDQKQKVRFSIEQQKQFRIGYATLVFAADEITYQNLQEFLQEEGYEDTKIQKIYGPSDATMLSLKLI